MRDCDFFPVGAVIPYAGALASNDKNETDLKQIQANLAREGWLFCDGSSLPQDAFWELYGVIGSSFGGDQQEFFLPDLRGRFIRGVDGSSARDPDSNTRTSSGKNGNEGNKVGSIQTDAFQGHEHNYIGVTESPDPAQTGEGDIVFMPNPDPSPTTDVVEEPNYNTPRVSKETRPVNIYLNYIIRYRHCVNHFHPHFHR